ncbi:MAG: hypothetical protein QM756_45070 [Polyangiaceae bacterium]
MSSEDIDARLARLREATSSIQASAGFKSRVLSALPNAPFGFQQAVSRHARSALSLAALLALSLLVVAWSSRGASDAHTAAQFDAAEYEW